MGEVSILEQDYCVHYVDATSTVACAYDDVQLAGYLHSQKVPWVGKVGTPSIISHVHTECFSRSYGTVGGWMLPQFVGAVTSMQHSTLGTDLLGGFVLFVQLPSHGITTHQHAYYQPSGRPFINLGEQRNIAWTSVPHVSSS